MDFRQSIQPNANRPTAPAPAPAAPEHKEDRVSKTSKQLRSTPSWLNILSMILLVGIAILLVGVTLIFNRGSNDNEGQFVKTADYQAVFLNNGQVYFGNIKDLTSSYVRMTNIYYLTQASSSSSNYSLVKLGCQQIHDPLDEMVINRDQVSFWENLNASGKVVQSIKQFMQQNPNGPNCSQVSSQTQASASNTQGSTTNTGDTSTSGSSTTTK